MKTYKKVLLLSILSAVLLILTLPPFNFSLGAWVALVPLLYLVFQRGHYKVHWVVLGFTITGAVANFFLSNWILAYQKRIFFTVWPLCTLIFPVFGLAIYALFRWVKNIFLQVLLVPCVWMVLLKLYSLTYIGYHWGEQFLAYSQGNIFLIQIVSVFGTMGLSFLILLFNASVSLVIIHRSLKSCIMPVFTILLILAAFIYGYNQLTLEKEHRVNVKALKIALVQPGKAGEPGFEHVKPIFNDSQFLTCMRRRAELPRFVTLNKEAQKKRPDLIVWPQYNFPADLRSSHGAINMFYVDFHTPIIVGTFVYEGRKLANVSMLLGRSGDVREMRTSVRPPPFRQINQTFGKGFEPLNFAGRSYFGSFKIGPLLCYEDVSAESAWKMVRNGAEILLIQVNDEVFQKTRLPVMHLGRDIFRAIETRRWVIRAATTGISAIIDPYGRIIDKIESNSKDTIFAQVPASQRDTFFTRHGDWIGVFSALCVILMVIISKIGPLKFS